jgi:superfamily II DNA/RNA helicase
MSTTMHGDRTQKQRSEAVQQFTNGKCPILVATSVAARGLDFPLIGYVVNYDLPDSSDFYIHRIGRTGRINERFIFKEYFLFIRSCWSFG